MAQATRSDVSGCCCDGFCDARLEVEELLVALVVVVVVAWVLLLGFATECFRLLLRVAEAPVEAPAVVVFLEAVFGSSLCFPFPCEEDEEEVGPCPCDEGWLLLLECWECDCECDCECD